MNSLKWSAGFFAALVLAVALGGLWFLQHEGDLPAPQLVEERSTLAHEPAEEPVFAEADETDERPDFGSPAPLAWPKGAVRGELVFTFANPEDLEAFLREARLAGLTNLHPIPELGVVRLRAGSDEAIRLAWRLAGNAQVALNPFVALPEVPPMDAVGANYRPFGDQALPWMGVPDDNSSWGEGVRIAILDTGVGDHPSLAGASITRLSVLGKGAEVGTHGTAVASLIVGQGEVRGIAPAAEILSIQVLGADGSGNAFDLARGILAAVEGGADIINLSLGSPSDAPFLRQAIQYAQAQGVLVVAASGNDGGGRSLFPAAYENVISVGAVDSHQQHLPFSNRDYNLSYVAPGFGLTVAGSDGAAVYMNGTSLASPLISGALAFVLSGDTSGEDPVAILTESANDGGPPGHDGYYGHGAPDMERMSWRGRSGIYDIALAGHYLDTRDGYAQLVVTVQNQGTEIVGGIILEVAVNGRRDKAQIGTLAPGGVGAARFPIGSLLSSREMDVAMFVSAPGITDARPWNNGRRVWMSPRE